MSSRYRSTGRSSTYRLDSSNRQWLSDLLLVTVSFCRKDNSSRRHYEAGEIPDRTPKQHGRRRRTHDYSSGSEKRSKRLNPAAEKMQDPAFRSMILDALKERNLMSKQDHQEDSDQQNTPSFADSPHSTKRSAEALNDSVSPLNKKHPEQERAESKETDEGEVNRLVEATLTLQTSSPERQTCNPNEIQAVKGLHEARMMDRYEFLGSISQGTYGVVYKGRCHSTGVIKAFKRVKKQNKSSTPEAFPLTSLREIQILSSISHPNIVGLHEVCLTDSRGILKVMDYAEFDLKRVLEVKKESFSASEIKCILKQILNALDFLHENWIMHRDLKPSNILYDNKGNVKLCDFGLARHYGEPVRKYTPLVVTLYYRAPELLLGMDKYSPAIDMWSLGCIMAEIVLGKVLFQETSELALISSILSTIGEPTEESWSKFKSLPNTKNIKLNGDSRNKLPDVFSSGYAVAGPELLTKEGVNFLCRLLEMNPDDRITAKEALEHEYFKEFPPPCHKRLLPTFVDPNKQTFT